MEVIQGGMSSAAQEQYNHYNDKTCGYSRLHHAFAVSFGFFRGSELISTHSTHSNAMRKGKGNGTSWVVLMTWGMLPIIGITLSVHGSCSSASLCVMSVRLMDMPVCLMRCAWWWLIGLWASPFQLGK